MERPKLRQATWDDVMRLEVRTRYTNFFEDNDCRDYGSFLLSEGDLTVEGTIDQNAVDTWLSELGGTGSVSLLVVDGNLSMGGDLLPGGWFGNGETFHGVLVTGSLAARNLEIGPNTRLVVVGETTVSGAIFLCYPEGGAEFLAPVRARYVVNDPDEFPVGWTLTEDSRVVISARDLSGLPEEVIGAVTDEDGRVALFAFYEWLTGEAESTRAPVLPAPKTKPGTPSSSFLIKEGRRRLAAEDVAGAWDALKQLAVHDEPEARAWFACAVLPEDAERAITLASSVQHGEPGFEQAQHVLTLGTAIVGAGSLLDGAATERQRAAVQRYHDGLRAFSRCEFAQCAEYWVDSVSESRKPGNDVARVSLVALFALLAEHPLVSEFRRKLMIVT